MALAKQISTLQLVSAGDSGGNSQLQVQNMRLRWENEYFVQPEEALDGTILSENTLAGKRLFIDVDYDTNIEPAVFNGIIDGYYTDAIYNNAPSIRFFPDADNTTQTAVADYQGGGFSAGNDEITITTHGLKNGQYVFYSNANVTVGGLTNGDYYYVTKVNNNVFSLSETIAGPDVDLTSISGTGDFLYEAQEIDVVITNVEELQDYRNSISRFTPSISMKSLRRYVVMPLAFQNTQ